MIPDGELFSFVRVDRAVEQYATIRDRLFRSAAAFRKPAEFDELAKFDRDGADGDRPRFGRVGIVHDSALAPWNVESNPQCAG